MLWSSEGSRSIKLKYDYKHLETIQYVQKLLKKFQGEVSLPLD